MSWLTGTCKRIINCDSISISFSGIDGPWEVNFKFPEFKIKKDILQAAADIAMLYDMFQYRNCEKMQQLPKDSPERAKFILEIHKNQLRLLELLTILRIAREKPSEKIEKVLTDWVAFTFTKKIREEAPIVLERVRGGEAVRESPPEEYYNNIKRGIAKAKMSSKYLGDALANPLFDTDKVLVE